MIASELLDELGREGRQMLVVRRPSGMGFGMVPASSTTAELLMQMLSAPCIVGIFRPTEVGACATAMADGWPLALEGAA